MKFNKLLRFLETVGIPADPTFIENVQFPFLKALTLSNIY
jgi:hypothetical protein